MSVNDPLFSRLRRSLDGRDAPELSADIVAGAAARPAPRLANPRRRVAVAGGALVAVAAATVVAVSLAAGAPRAPLFTASGAQRSAGTAEDAAIAPREGRWIEYRYLPGDALSRAAGNGVVYQLKLSGSAEDALRRAARALGVSGEPRPSQYSDPRYPSWVVGPEDGSGPSLGVGWTGTGNWWYGDPSAYPASTCVDTLPGGTGGVDPAKPTDGLSEEEKKLADQKELARCAPPEAPAESSAPSAADARELARAIFAATGLEVAAADIRVTADDWQTTASASLVVAGVETALEWSVSWGPTGKISWASGHSIEVVARGEYGTVSAADAVARLSDWRWFGAAGPDYWTTGVIAYATRDVAGSSVDTADAAVASGEGGASAEGETPPDDPGTSEPGAPGTQPTDPGADPDDPPTAEPVEPTAEPVPTDEPTPVEPEPRPEPLPEEPEVVTVAIDVAEPTLLLMWDADGGAWLVPGFAFQTPEGWWSTVASLVAGVIALPEPVQVEPLVTEDIAPAEDTKP